MTTYQPRAVGRAGAGAPGTDAGAAKGREVMDADYLRDVITVTADIRGMIEQATEALNEIDADAQ